MFVKYIYHNVIECDCCTLCKVTAVSDKAFMYTSLMA